MLLLPQDTKEKLIQHAQRDRHRRHRSILSNPLWNLADKDCCIGILGGAIVHELGKHPEQWQTVHALSRSQKGTYPSNVKHDHVDLTQDAKGMADQLKGIKAEYVFFAAYLQQDTEQGNWDVNGWSSYPWWQWPSYKSSPVQDPC